jgi:hypothetical protein
MRSICCSPFPLRVPHESNRKRVFSPRRVIVAADSVHFTDADGIVYGWVFAPGTFSAAGNYTAFDYPPYIVSDVATMTVRAVQATRETTSKVRSVKCLYLWKCATGLKTASRTAGP